MRTRDHAPRRRGAGTLTALALGLALAATLGCRQDMHDQPKYEPFEANPFFADGKSARDLVPNTVPRGQLRADEAYYTGLGADGEGVPGFPLTALRERWPGAVDELGDEEFTRLVLRRGQQRYGMFCTPCHGAVGAGNGMIVQRGFKVPTSFHDERLVASPPGYFVNVITAGFGQMSSYASQVPPEDRWAIAAYIRTLQLSQGARSAELAAADLARLAEPPAPVHGAADHADDSAHAGAHSGEK